jgi:hypothetical protein
MIWSIALRDAEEYSNGMGPPRFGGFRDANSKDTKRIPSAARFGGLGGDANSKDTKRILQRFA